MEPQAREAVAQLTVAVGRPMVHDLRSMCDAVSYVVKNGVEWRALPVHVTDREAVYAFARLGELERHLGDGVIEAIVDAALGKGRLRRRQRRRIMSYPLGHSHTRAPPPLSPKQTRRQEQNTGASTSRHATNTLKSLVQACSPCPGSPGHLLDQHRDLGIERLASSLVTIGPAPADQSPVPAQPGNHLPQVCS